MHNIHNNNFYTDGFKIGQEPEMICCISDLKTFDSLLFAVFVKCKGEAETTVNQQD